MTRQELERLADKSVYTDSLGCASDVPVLASLTLALLDVCEELRRIRESLDSSKELWFL